MVEKWLSTMRLPDVRLLEESSLHGWGRLHAHATKPRLNDDATRADAYEIVDMNLAHAAAQSGDPRMLLNAAMWLDSLGEPVAATVAHIAAARAIHDGTANADDPDEESTWVLAAKAALKSGLIVTAYSAALRVSGPERAEIIASIRDALSPTAHDGGGC